MHLSSRVLLTLSTLSILSILSLAPAATGAAPRLVPRAEDDVPSPRDQVRDHVRVLRDTRRAADEKRAAMRALLDLGTEGPYELARHCAREAAAARKAYEKEQRRVLAEFERLAPRVARERAGRSESREVDEARDTVLRQSRSPKLTKQVIQSICDPAMERLRELLEVDVDDVLDLDEGLADAYADLFELLDEEHFQTEFWWRAIERLEESAEGTERARRLDEPAEPITAEDVVDSFAFAARLATPMREADRKALLGNRLLTPELLPEEARGIAVLNDMRIRLGIGALRIDPRLCAAGRDHSKDMFELGFFSHTSPVEGKTTFGQRASNFKASASSENIARGQSTGAGAISGWWYSPGHHRNMMGGHGRVGLGRHEDFWTQLFG